MGSSGFFLRAYAFQSEAGKRPNDRREPHMQHLVTGHKEFGQPAGAHDLSCCAKGIPCAATDCYCLKNIRQRWGNDSI
jgi:hypothetical protein